MGNVCVVFMGDLQPLCPEVLTPVQENRSILRLEEAAIAAPLSSGVSLPADGDGMAPIPESVN